MTASSYAPVLSPSWRTAQRHLLAAFAVIGWRQTGQAFLARAASHLSPGCRQPGQAYGSAAADPVTFLLAVLTGDMVDTCAETWWTHLAGVYGVSQVDRHQSMMHEVHIMNRII